MRKLIERLKAWWYKPSATSIIVEAFKTMRMAREEDVQAVTALMRKYTVVQIDLDQLRDEYERNKSSLDDKFSNSYARIAERQLIIANKQIDRHADVISELLGRWRAQVERLQEEVDDEKQQREAVEHDLQEILTQNMNTDLNVVGAACSRTDEVVKNKGNES